MALSIPYVEVKQPMLRYDLNRNVVQGTRTIMIDESDAFQAVQDLAGRTYIDGTTLFQVPRDNFPGFAWLPVSTIEQKSATDYFGLKCVGALNTLGIPDDPNGKAVFIIHYETTDFSDVADDDPGNPDGGPFFTITRDASSEYHSIDKEGLEWDDLNDDGSREITDVKAQITAKIQRTVITLTWHRVTGVKFNTINDYVGTINQGSFVGRTAETIMFSGISDKRQVQWDGDLLWEVDFRFEVKEIKFDNGSGGLSIGGWNHKFRSDPGTGDPHWQKYRLKNGKRLYLPVDWVDVGLFDVETG